MDVSRDSAWVANWAGHGAFSHWSHDTLHSCTFARGVYVVCADLLVPIVDDICWDSIWVAALAAYGEGVFMVEGSGEGVV